MLARMEKKQFLKRISAKANQSFDPAYVVGLFGLQLNSIPVDDLLFGHFIEELMTSEKRFFDLADVIEAMESLSHESLSTLRQKIVTLVRESRLQVNQNSVH